MTHKYCSFGLLASLLTLTIVSRESHAATAPTLTFSATPTSVARGGSSVIKWSTTNATACTGSHSWTGSEALNGDEHSMPVTADRYFVLTCTGAGGSITKSVTVTINNSTPLPTVTISATPTTIASGSSSVIKWSTSNATACTGSGGWSGTEGLSGDQSTGVLTADRTYALKCTGAGGSASESATVSVTAAPASGDATLSWKAPTTNTNGTPVVALTGYHLYYGNSAGLLTKSIAISGATTTSYEITGLTAGTWYFAVAADAADGTESAKSAIGSTTI